MSRTLSGPSENGVLRDKSVTLKQPKAPWVIDTLVDSCRSFAAGILQRSRKYFQILRLKPVIPSCHRVSKSYVNEAEDVNELPLWLFAKN